MTNTTSASGEPEDLDLLDRDHDASLLGDDGGDGVSEPSNAASQPAGRTTDEDDDDVDNETDDDDVDDEEDDGDDDRASAGGDSAGSDSVASDADLFRQSEIAADYIEGLLDILDFDGDIDELVQNGRPMVEVVGGRLNELVGNRGATLEALQELSRLAVYRQTGEPSRLLLDVGGFRSARRKELIAVAKNAAERVRQHGETVRLEPMSAFERKCVHDVINALVGVQSESEGVEPSRRIIVRPDGL